MKKAYLTFIQTILTFVLMFGMQASLNPAMAQETNELDSIEVIDENSSAFNDSVQFDDMEPSFMRLPTMKRQQHLKAADTGASYYMPALR
jgi:hypothetical protein